MSGPHTPGSLQDEGHFHRRVSHESMGLAERVLTGAPRSSALSWLRVASQDATEAAGEIESSEMSIYSLEKSTSARFIALFFREC